MMNRRLFTAAALFTLAVLFVAAKHSRLLADDKPAAEGSSKLARDLIGTWLFAGTPDNIVEPAADSRHYKSFTGKHWSVTQAEPATGEVVSHHGGTYTLDGDKYEETVLYATQSNAPQIKQKFKFKIKVEGDTLTQIGDGNQYNEVWKRAK
jgi:hypothetical protein